jgi:hypothetical protein
VGLVGWLVVLAVVLFIGTGFPLRAQTNFNVRPLPRNYITQNPVFAKNPAALELITNLLAEPAPELTVPEVSSHVSSRAGTYWTLKGAPVPWPVNPFPDLPVYAIGTNNVWLVDDRSVDHPILANKSLPREKTCFQ